MQLALFWTAAAFLAAGIFLTPFIAGREPTEAVVLVYVLLRRGRRSWSSAAW